MGRKIFGLTLALVMTISFAAPAAQGAPGVSIQLFGPETFRPGQVLTFSGSLSAVAVGLPLQQVDLLVDGDVASSTTTALDGTFEVGVVLSESSHTHVVRAVHLNGTPLSTYSNDIVVEIEKHTLTVAKTGTGNGIVTSNDGSIFCGAGCTAEFPYGTTVTLQATPSGGSAFAGWGGSCGGTTCSVSMSQDHLVTATFTAPPSISFNVAFWSDVESTPAVIEVIRTGSTTGTSSANYSVLGLTASSQDFVGSGGTVSFAPGQTSANISVNVVNDTLDENDETFRVTLHGPSGATLGTQVTHDRIIIDDDAPPTVNFASPSSSGSEGAGMAFIDVVLSGPSGRAASVNFHTENDTAFTPSDFPFTSATLTFSPGQTLATIAVPMVNDSVEEPTEQFRVALTSPVNLNMIGALTHTRAILDDDLDPALNEQNIPAEADFVRLKFPSALSLLAGQTSPGIYAELAESHVTSTSPNGPAPGVLAQVGYGPVGSDPRLGGWTWGLGAFNGDFVGFEEYAGSFVAPSRPGTYRFTYRFQFNGFPGWTYADLNGAGSNAGLTFDPSDIGTMTVS